MEGIHYVREMKKGRLVLILIIMEDTHGVTEEQSLAMFVANVLILIIMEDTHGEHK